MIELKHPDHGYRVTVPDEAVELQQAVWRTGPNGHVDGADDEHFSLRVPVAYAIRLLEPFLDMNDPKCPTYKLIVLPDLDVSADRSGGSQVSARNNDDSRRWAQTMVTLAFSEPFMLPSVTACATWLADGPRPNLPTELEQSQLAVDTQTEPASASDVTPDIGPILEEM